MSIGIATMGKYCSQSGTSVEPVTSSGGGGGGGYTQVLPRKPLVTVAAVKYHSVSPKRVSITSIRET